MENSTHPLRYMVHSQSPEITDGELDELQAKLPFDSYDDSDQYEYSGNFIITKDNRDFSVAVENMCCGIVSEEVLLSNGSMLFFAFDYGH